MDYFEIGSPKNRFGWSESRLDAKWQNGTLGTPQKIGQKAESQKFDLIQMVSLMDRIPL